VPLPSDESGQPERQAAASRPGGRSARVRTAVFDAATELLREPDWSRVTMARIAERAGVNSTTVYRRWGSLENLVGDLADATVSERAPLPDTGTLAGDIRAHSQILVNDLTGESRRFLLRALIIAGNGADDDSGQRALLERTGGARIMFERAAARGEPTVDAIGYFEGVVGPLYGWALLVPSLVPRRAPALVETFLAGLENRRPPEPSGPSADS